MIKLKLLLEQLAVGSQWHSCKAWKLKGTSYWNGDEGRPKITVTVNDSGFHLRYIGAASGYAISHGKDGTGDSLHQAFNVVMCECNPYLLKGGLKPNIENIETNHSVSAGKHTMNIWIPFIDTDGVWQINRRGGMGWDPGPGKILGIIGKVDNLIGPITVKVASITEYFVTYTVNDARIKKSNAQKSVDTVILDKPTDKFAAKRDDTTVVTPNINNNLKFK